MVVALINGLYKFELADIRKGERIFVGLKNYIKLITDERFLNSVKVTIIYTFFSVGLSLIIGVLFALLIEKPFRGKNIVRSLLLIPMVMAPAAVGILWKNFFFNPSNGLINVFLSFFGIKGPGWLVSVPWALISVIFLETLTTIPLVLIIVDAALMSVPNSTVEAAKIDGAGYWRQVFSIKIPMIRSAILMALIFRVSTSFRSFDFIYSTTMGQPGVSTEALGLLVYKLGMKNFQISYATATSVFMGLFVGTVTFVLLIYVMRTGGERFWSK
jgi:multiple sugar transport system permease protein